MSKHNKRRSAPAAEDVPPELLEYEDPDEDVYDETLYEDDGVMGSDSDAEDDAADTHGDDNDADDEDEHGMSRARLERIAAQHGVRLADGAKFHPAKEEVRQSNRAFLPRRHALENGDRLTYDASAYDMLHALRVDWPCLSLTTLKDTLGTQRQRFPHTMYIAAGTEADSAGKNKLCLMKMSSLCKTKHDEAESSDDSSGDDTEDEEAKVVVKTIRHNGSVNRIKAMPHRNNILATWSETSNVYIWDAKSHIDALDNAGVKAPVNRKPICTLKNHQQEGFAMDWSKVRKGRLLTGDIASDIYLWEQQGDSPNWAGSKTPFQGHTDSVEDLQWSPVELDVFASCSSDNTVKVWDARTRQTPALSIDAHDDDVNVISWNSRVTYLMVSGCEDGSFRIWDLRSLDAPAAQFNWHKQPISGVEWSPHEDSVVAVTCGEQTTIWDLSLERDTDAQSAAVAEENTLLPENLDEVDEEVPPQLLFVHQGQSETKEVHWHAQIPGALVTTAIDSINVWKPFNVGNHFDEE